MVNALERGWLSREGVAALLGVAILTTAVATAQVIRVARLQRASFSRADRRLLAQTMIAIGTALIFWLLLIGAYLLRALEDQLGAPWWQ